jgi:O-antigen/teichoic acid export membrane protein
MIGVTFVGFYSVSIMTKSYISQLSSFGTVLFPRLMQVYGKNEKIDDIKKYAIIPQTINAYTLPLLLGVIFFVSPLLIRLVLPKFVPGILAIQILLIDMFFRSCSPQAIHFITALKKQVKAIPILICAIILNIIGDFCLIKMGHGIYGVAWVASVISFLVFVGLQTYAMMHFATFKEIVLFFMEIITPFIYTLVLVLLLEFYIKLPNVYVTVIFKCLLLGIGSLPILNYINRKTNVISLVLDIVKENTILKLKRK